MFTLAGTTWSQQASVLPAGAQPGDYFGSRFVLSGDGSLLATSSQGKVVLYDHTGTSWTQGQTLTAANAEGVYAMAASADGRKLLVGAPTDPSCSSVTTGGDPSNAGCVTAGASYLSERTGQTWSSTYLKATNTDAHDLFGSSGAMSSDGALLAIGAIGESSRATGVNGNQTDNTTPYIGAAYVLRAHP